MAAAEAAERVRVAGGAQVPSPLGGKQYVSERGEFNLGPLVPSELDDEIADFVERWRQTDESQREHLRSSLTLDDNYTLIQFAKRMAVRALNTARVESCNSGLTALAAIDESRIDSRDASWAAGLLNHAAGVVGAAVAFDQAAAVATPGMAKLLREAVGSTLQDWGQREWRSDDGVGVVRSGWASYEPTRDLVAIAQRIESEVLSERYTLGDVEVATEIPMVWFTKDLRDHAASVMERALGVVSTHGHLRPVVAPPAGQMLLAWIAELPQSDDGPQLVADVGRGDCCDGRFVVGVSTGRLFVLLVGGSWHTGVEPVESPEALRDMGSRIRRCIEETNGAT
jgi:hypothetical protein